MKKRIVALLVAVLLMVASVIPAFAAGSDSSSGFNAGKSLLISLGVGLVVALIVIFILWSQLKSVHAQQGAAEYIKKDSMNVTGSYEHFLYSRVTSVKIPKNDDK